MKDLKDILEASILADIDNSIDAGDTNALASLLSGGNEENIREARNIIYDDTINNEKRIRRRSEFKQDKLYIQFYTDDLSYITNDIWGFRIGTCNPDKKNSDVIVAIPTIRSGATPGSYCVINKSSALSMDSYLKRPIYPLPDKYKDLFKKLFIAGTKKKLYGVSKNIEDEIIKYVKSL